MSRLARLWPFRRRPIPVPPEAVREFRVSQPGRDDGPVHRVEAGKPLADFRERGARMLFETDDPAAFMLGEARDANGRLVMLICGWTSYSLGHVVGPDGALREKRRAAAWGWPVEEIIEAAQPLLDAEQERILNGDSPTADPVGILNAVETEPAPVTPRRPRAKGVPQAKRGG